MIGIKTYENWKNYSDQHWNNIEIKMIDRITYKNWNGNEF